MDYRKVLGIIFIILGLLFAVYPVYSAATVSWIAGICLIAFGFASIIDGKGTKSVLADASGTMKIVSIFDKSDNVTLTIVPVPAMF